MEDQQYIQLQQEYLTIKSKLNYAESEYNRQKELNQSKASSDKVFQQTEMEYKTQKISLSALAEKLRLININPKIIIKEGIPKETFFKNCWMVTMALKFVFISYHIYYQV
ncbi:MAG: hypothetical protein ACK57X_15445, partial [Bacteroidota bacterium]